MQYIQFIGLLQASSCLHDPLDMLADGWIVLLPFRGEFDRTAVSDKKLYANVLLQRFYLVADGSMGHMQLVCCFSKTPKARNCFKGT